jgi:hypothetical protein
MRMALIRSVECCSPIFDWFPYHPRRVEARDQCKRRVEYPARVGGCLDCYTYSGGVADRIGNAPEEAYSRICPGVFRYLGPSESV